jgi:hypothetical protein
MTRAILAAAAIGVAACSEAMMTGFGPVSTSVAVSPTPNASAVARTDTVRVRFDMPVDSVSCLTRFALHMGDSTGTAVAGRMWFGDGYRQMMFVPDAPMQPGTRYFGHVRDSVMMRQGMHDSGMSGSMMGGGWMMMTGQMPAGAVRMSDGMGWSFTTGT